MESRNKIVGKRGEDLAEKFLIERGMVVIDRNVRSARAEIDLIAVDGNIVRFVEVKSRMIHSEATIESSLGRAKLRQIVKGAADYIAKYRVAGCDDIAFDLVVVVFDEGGDYTIDYIPQFFYPTW